MNWTSYLSVFMALSMGALAVGDEQELSLPTAWLEFTKRLLATDQTVDQTLKALLEVDELSLINPLGEEISVLTTHYYNGFAACRIVEKWAKTPKNPFFNHLRTHTDPAVCAELARIFGIKEAVNFEGR